MLQYVLSHNKITALNSPFLSVSHSLQISQSYSFLEPLRHSCNIVGLYGLWFNIKIQQFLSSKVHNSAYFSLSG
uniref:Uncharacterized protein n=1 Tax=Octopus bimaculoides TaxID=37653 RepID=A0A0L8IE04_OCTBM